MEKSAIQHTIEVYWSAVAPRFSKMIRKDLESNCKYTWLQAILKNAPEKTGMDVLDVGTGPGFFSIILSEAGNRVTGIDCSGEMLKEARKNADAAGVNPLLLKMDSHILGFPDSSFDLVVSRDVTWTLYDPVKAYKEWKRVLRPGGRILVFDANYGRHCFDTGIAAQKERDECLYRERFGETPGTNTADLEYIGKMFLSDKLRPAWDISALSLLGMDVYTGTDVGRELYTEQDRLLNSTTPLFLVAAEKRLDAVKSRRTFYAGSWKITQTKICWD
jgi:ubiquinone/menaquinone biosynthesis C-methylase UbiE